MNYSKSYLKAIVICHGKSEKQMCDFIKSNLRLKIHIEADKKGEKSIQITSLMNTLSGLYYKNKNGFFNYFDDAEKLDGKQKLMPTFKVFIIMDTDDCTDEQQKAFVDKTMFLDHWLYDYIVPIYNTPELESVLVAAGIQFQRKSVARKKEYVKIFPTDPKYQTNDVLQLQDFQKALEKCQNTNMNEFVSFCLQCK